MDPYIGEVRMFAGNFAPVGWLFCNGDALPISQYEVLYTLLGTTYGGDGMTTFNLPDLRGRTPIHQGQGPGLSARTMGDSLGSETVSLTAAQMPQHFHPVSASSAKATDPGPSAGMVWGVVENGQYANPPANAAMSLNATTASGKSAPHPNMGPFQAVSFIIATEGIFPSRS
ncbi:MAG TPA: tail fiber protein [Usitatibacter sp.]|jgi:microcystin-dependent protein|nr:tail fiber protein [Usitatibacter sp.]